MIKQIAFASVVTMLAAGVVGISGIDSARATGLPLAPVPQASLVVDEGLQLVGDNYKKKKYHHGDGKDKHRHVDGHDGHRHVHGKYRHGHWVYAKKYGPRYNYRHGRYKYYYGGWWYPRPWWTLEPGIYLSF